MNADEPICLCHRVSLGKLLRFMDRTRPEVASQLSDCLGAGTGCHSCVPVLRSLFEQWRRGEEPCLDLRGRDAARAARLSE